MFYGCTTVEKLRCIKNGFAITSWLPENAKHFKPMLTINFTDSTTSTNTHLHNPSLEVWAGQNPWDLEDPEVGMEDLPGKALLMRERKMWNVCEMFYISNFEWCDFFFRYKISKIEMCFLPCPGPGGGGGFISGMEGLFASIRKLLKKTTSFFTSSILSPCLFRMCFLTNSGP